MKGWKLYGKVAKTQQKAVLKQLKEQGYSTTTDYFTGVIYYRKNRAVKRVRLQDFATQDYLKTKKREKFLERFKKLVVIWSICLLLVAGFQSWKDSPQANAMSLANKEFVLEPNLSPVRFTPDELKMIEQKRQYIQATLISTEKAKETETDDVLRAIEKASKQYGVSYDLMKRIAKCESGFNPNARNRSSTASGLYQHIKATWRGHRIKMGLDPSLDLRFNAEESAKTAAWSISNGGLRNWDASKSCWN